MEASRRSKWIRNQGVSNHILVTKVVVENDTTDIKIPHTHKDALQLPEAKHWADAMNYKMSKLEEMDTWVEIDKKNIPDNAQVFPGMWVNIVILLKEV